MCSITVDSREQETTNARLLIYTSIRASGANTN